MEDSYFDKFFVVVSTRLQRTLKNRFTQSQKMYLVLYLTVERVNIQQALLVIQKNVQYTMNE